MTAVADRLRRSIRSAGPIPFARFMEEALYGEGGYYAGDDLAIGLTGDFVTGSSLSPLFGRATARLLERLDRVLGRPAELLEAGYGSGAHLAAVASVVGAGRRLRGWDRVGRPLPPGVGRVDRLEEVGEGEVEGLVFAYELFDALPVHRLVGRQGGGLGELAVGLAADGAFEWVEAEATDPALSRLVGDARLAPGQVADLAPGWAPLMERLARRLGRGLLVVCDYGYERRRLLDPRVRRHGTLACYRRQRVHRDPFVDVGRQDLTAHVDFTALREAAEAAGLECLTLTRQALWLVACGIFADLEGAPPERRREAMDLLSGEGMGEEIRVLVLARGVAAGELFEPGVLG